MKIHSDILTRDDLLDALHAAKCGSHFVRLDERGSRSRARGFDFRLGCYGGTRRHNSGHYGADDTYAATWDDHGHFFARVFLADPNVIIGRYDGEVDFHVITDGLYTIVRAGR